MKIIKTDPFHPQIEVFEKLCKDEWAEYFEDDFGGPQIRNLSDPYDAEIYLIEEQGEIIGGGIINTKIIVNYYEDPKKEVRKKELQSKGIQNFTYFIVDEKYQSKGYGGELLEHIKKLHPKIWIKPELKKIYFYQKRDFIIDLPGDKTDEYPIMTYIK